jgi:hypothetical protein
MPRVHMPDGKIVNFPDGMSEQDMSKAMDEIHGPSQQSAAPEEKSVGGFIGNVVSSGGKFLSDMASGVGSLAKTVYDGDKLLLTNPREALSRAAGVTKLPEVAPRIISAAGQAVKNRYGGVEQIKNTLYNDPVGVLGDVATAADGVGLLSKASGASKLARIAEGVSEATNPMRAITAPVAKLSHEAGVATVRGTLRPPASVRDDFGGSRGIAEGVLKDRVYSEASAARKLNQSVSKADQMIADAQANLAPGVDTQKVAAAVMGQPQATAKLRARLGVPDASPELQATADGILKHNGVEIPLTDAQTMKREAQALAFEAGADNQSVKKAAEIAKAKALREGIEASVPGVKDVNEQSQRLLGSKLAFATAEDRPRALTGMMSILGGLGGFTAGGPVGAAVVPALMQLRDSPRAGAMMGIAADSFGRGMNAQSLRKAALVARLLGEVPDQ